MASPSHRIVPATLAIPARKMVFFLGLLLVLPLGLSAGPAHADTNAETFVSQNIQHGLNILNNHNLTQAQKRAQFRDFLISLTDLHRIALFTLGPARRTATPAQISAFTDAFRDFAVAIYDVRLSAFSGQTLKVTGATQRAPGDTIVSTVMVNPHGAGNEQPLRVDFRVMTEHGKNVIIDVGVAGIWLAIEERDQFASFLSEHGNSVPALTAHLQALTQNLQNGGSLPQQQGG